MAILNNQSGGTWVRVHEDCGEGLCVQKPVMYNTKTGAQKQAAITNAGKIPIQTATAKGTIVLPSKNVNNMAMNNAVKPAEKVDGAGALYRSEQPNWGNGQPQTLWFSIENTSAVATTQVVIGDGAGLITLGLGIPALPGTITVNSSYGATGLSVFARLSGYVPSRLHELHVVNTVSGTGASSQEFFNTGSMKQARAAYNMESVFQSNVDFRMLFSATDFQQNIREYKDYRMIMDSLSGFVLSVPPLQKVTITMYLRSIADTYSMDLQTTM